MPLVSLDQIVKTPGQGWAVGAFITFNMETTEAIFEAAEEERSPLVIMMYLPFFLRHGKGLVPMVKALAQDVTVPVCLHLDHGQSLEHLEQAIKMGFSSVMIDGSALPVGENITLTKKAVELAHSFGVSVEAELGHVPGGEQYLGQGQIGEQKSDPEVAGRFCQETGVDALAVAVGNLQGGKAGSARLDFNTLTAIRKSIPSLLVLHGGTALNPDEVRQALEIGVDKINYFTELRRAYSRGLLDGIAGDPETTEPEALMAKAELYVKNVVRERIRVFGSSGKAG
ncbi:fructose-bisphosphate aldolase [Peptococcaceae bacterium CEB3]|nr:fructose-bisphosphate aldolase [Peptococcaceae bacterium CEB3]